MLLTRKGDATTRSQSRFSSGLADTLSRALPTMDRRGFLKRSGIGVGAGIALSELGLIKKAKAAIGVPTEHSNVVVRRTVCTHCSVGCAVDAVVENGIWVRQNPVFDSPINLGAHCAKGAALREHGHGEHRLKYPMKLVGGKYVRISWELALSEIATKLLEIKKTSGPDSTFFVGSSKHNNEQAMLLRKFVSFYGTNNTDHQARICHSTTVAGVANTWGYGAMTNSFNDMQNSKAALYIGSNAAEAHPVSMLHLLHAKEGGCKVIVVDPRYTRTAAKSNQYIRIRSGSDIPFLYGMMHHIFNNGWEDKKYIEARVYGMDKIREEAMKWTPEKVEEACGVPEDQVFLAARTMAENRPSTVVWCMGQTQHTIGNAIVRASCLLQLVLGNIGVSGGGTNIFRGHDNVQGATDVGPNPDSLPGYFGLAAGAWKHWCKVWGVDYEWVKKQFASTELMEKSGATVSRWIDAVLEDPEHLDQPNNVKAMVFWGHAPNSQTRGLEMKKAFDKLDMLVVIDPYPSATAAMAAMTVEAQQLNPQRQVYLLPAATQFETSGSVTASNRSIQWREQVIEPLFESRTDHMIMYQLAEKLGFAKELVAKLKLVKGKGGMLEPEPESMLEEINRGCWTIGYTGQSPLRLKAHMRNMHLFDVKTLKCKGGKDPVSGYDMTGDYFGLPWPCWGTPELKHPGSPNLYDTSKHVMDGGGNFRANFGVEREGVSLLAEDGSHSLGSDITTGYPEFDHVLLKKLGWWDDLTEAEKLAAEGKNWKTDLSGGIQRVALKVHGCSPFGNAKARAIVWNFPDPVPLHREPLFGTRPDLVAKYPTHDDKKAFWRMPTLYKSVQQKNVENKLYEKFPIILTSGRLVEYEGGGEETRSNPWLAELQQENFVELNPQAASERGIRDGEFVIVSTPTGARIKVRALVTPRVAADTAFIPFHFSGWWQGKDMQEFYPAGAMPIVRGEAVNTATTYGYDAVTMMQETKTTICNIERFVA
ncbi:MULTISPECIES: formate dehydrogenase subunit alpha [unclassified Undibacterium]|uniref:formate dehydrogenase subunit alpha n=1 Tax=unclassified Undibacterium TaxID=2630295 RepID=UPI002AC8F28E|nr:MULTISPECIES: formate dehydrogenase subunit alpha [unclassified Undibacterium]MEB0141031.1 formate dehydrogenase subunit alpha [Undibacterium sp. CCC2.1]MEB0174013.1 formate dehydrogenase subunit alpha [Undibacterium sp. CCC1.1]MEB0177969.1 formate dehydrogenase subunit alpha [Undibacterium sp. CCC3.4]MEB0217207.1 formate dehydrogenase subunit alpha [Undibacterium sp. 5I2]WPX42183.1 formate dehydrogenase subunit alpha [Undibacterium sp. CCC3.4]